MNAPFPKLTKGRLLGSPRVDHRHFNRVFRSVEQAERDHDAIVAILAQRSNERLTPTITARLRARTLIATTTHRYKYSWIEVDVTDAATPVTWIDRTEGALSSTVSGDQYAAPAYNMGEFEDNGEGTHVRDNEIVTLQLVRGISGGLVYVFRVTSPSSLLGNITQVYGSGVGARYDAASYDGSMTVTNVFPINRWHAGAAIIAAGVGDVCRLLRMVDGETTVLEQLTERLKLRDCAEEAGGGGGDNDNSSVDMVYEGSGYMGAGEPEELAEVGAGNCDDAYLRFEGDNY